jgi:translocator protein
MNYETYYSSIAKPFFAPEPWVFGLAWGIIYPLIIVAAALTAYWMAKGMLRRRALITSLFSINIIANLAFTPLQLQFPEAWYATADIFVVLLTLIGLQVFFWRQSKILFLLLVPYLLWGMFATVLQITIFFMNFA